MDLDKRLEAMLDQIERAAKSGFGGLSPREVEKLVQAVDRLADLEASLRVFSTEQGKLKIAVDELLKTMQGGGNTIGLLVRHDRLEQAHETNRRLTWTLVTALIVSVVTLIVKSVQIGP